MLENGLFFALGFLGAALFALMIAPAIWRRAVTLTRKRIEETVPLTLNEFQAEKDHLRAEFAMSATRLEASNAKLKETAAEQLIDINRKKSEILNLSDNIGERDTRISDLDNHNKELRAQVDQRDEDFNSAKTKLVTTEINLEQKTAALEDIEGRYSSAIDEFDGQKIEMVARETRMDTIKDEFAEIKKAKKDEEAENSRLLKELKAASSGFEKQKTAMTNWKLNYQRFNPILQIWKGGWNGATLISNVFAAKLARSHRASLPPQKTINVKKMRLCANA